MALALQKAARLKPDVRLAQALSEYEAILANDQKAKLRVYRGQPAPNEDDVMRLTAEIDRENSSRRSRRCVGPRLTNFLQAVQQFTPVAETVVGGSQSFIASSIWGVLKMSLQIAYNFSSYFEKLSTLFMHIGRTCPRNKELAWLYLNSNHLQDAYCEYFIVVIQLCKQIVLFTRKAFFNQLFSTIVASYQSEFGHFESDLARLANAIRDEADLASKKAHSLEERETSKFREVSSIFSAKMSQELQYLNKKKLWKTKSRFLNACSEYNYEAAWKRARKAGTTGWLFGRQEYKQWMTGSISTALWCAGALGSGKTVLAANVIENVRLTASNGTTGYFFCEHDIVESLKTRTIIGAIARQLLIQTEPKRFDFLEQIQNIELDSDQILDCLQRLLPQETQTYFVVIDGMYESGEKEQRLLLGLLKDLMKSRHIFQIFCTSRLDQPQWLMAILKSSQIVSMPVVSAEITAYIRRELKDRIESQRLTFRDEDTMNAVQDELAEKSEGMYLWLAFQLDEICAQDTDESILQTLRSLPKDLPTTFARILRKVEASEVSDATNGKLIFELVAVAQRPMTLEALREAMSIVPGDTNWDPMSMVNNMARKLRCCGSLLVTDEEELTVRFTHQSVKQFLVSGTSHKTMADIAKYSVHLPEADLRLGNICVTYLNCGYVTMPMIKATSNPPLVDQLVYIPSGITGTVLGSPVIANLTNRLLRTRFENEPDFRAHLIQAANSATSSRAQSQTGLDFLSYAEEYWLFHTKNFVPIEEQRAGHCFRALVNGDVRIVKLPWAPENLADFGPLSIGWVRLQKHSGVLNLLILNLRNPATLNAPKFKTLTDPFEWNAFLEMITHILKDVRLDPNSFISFFTHETILILLYQAANRNDYQYCELLAETRLREGFPKGDDHGSYDLKKDYPEEPYHLLEFHTEEQSSVRRGKLSAILLLLGLGADPISESWNNKLDVHALRGASENNPTQILQLLFIGGSLTSYLHTEFGNALQAAANLQADSPEIIDLLLNRGMDVNAQGGAYGNALQAACYHLNRHSVKLLLTKGADPNARGGKFYTALQATALASRGTSNYKIETLRLLLQSGADVNTQGGLYGNVLQAAIYQDPLDTRTVKLLLMHGADVNAQGGEYGSPLHAAILSPRTWSLDETLREESVELLLEYGADSNLPGKNGTPMEVAKAEGLKRIVTLLEIGLTKSSSNGRSPSFTIRELRQDTVRLSDSTYPT